MHPSIRKCGILAAIVALMLVCLLFVGCFPTDGFPSFGDSSGEVTPENPDKDDETSENPDQGGATPENPDQGGATPENPDQGGATPENPDQGGVTPENPDQGGATPENPDQGGATPENPDQGGATPENPDQGGATPENPDQGGATPENPDQGGTTPENPDQGGTTPENPDQGGDENNDPPACSHAYGEWTVSAPATCEGEGERERVCSLCQATETETVDPIGHDYSDPYFVWEAEGGSYTVTYHVDCDNDASHNILVSASVTNSVTDATACEDGEIVYTATALVGDEEFTSERRDPIYAPHTLVTVGAGSESGHAFSCACGEHTETVAHTPGEAVTEGYAPSCLCQTTYHEVIYCTECSYKISVSAKTAAALEHEWQFVSFNYLGEDVTNLSVSATFSCAKNGAAEPHNESFTPKVEKTLLPPSCTEDGSVSYQVSITVNDQTYTDTKTYTIACGHTPASKSVIENEIAATCTKKGSYDIVYYCVVCEQEVSREKVETKTDSTAHDYAYAKFSWLENSNTVWRITVTFTCAHSGAHTTSKYGVIPTYEKKEATCTEDGYEGYFATVTIGERTFTDSKVSVLQKGHKALPEFGADNTQHWRVCSVCGEEYSHISHMLSTEKRNEVSAGCATEGSYDNVTYCFTCKHVVSTEHIVVSATGRHRERSPVTENETDSTCTTHGTYDSVYYCRNCEQEIRRVTYEKPLADHDLHNEVIEAATCASQGKQKTSCKNCSYESVSTLPQLTHTYESGACIFCGLTKVSEGLSFAEVEGGYALSGLGNCKDSAVVIPSEYNGKPVVAIASGAFKGNTSIVAVRFSSLVTTIEAEAFSGCTSLKTVVFSETITSIGSDAFYGCTSLLEIVLPDSVSTVGKRAFYGCTSMIRIVIGEGVTYIGGAAFGWCTALQTLEYNAVRCADFKSSDGVFSGDGINVDGYDLVIGNTVKHIPAYFLHNDSNFNDMKYFTHVKSVSFEEGSELESIGMNAFRAAYVGHVTIHVPESVQTVGEYAFSRAYYLSNGTLAYFDLSVLIEAPSVNWSGSALNCSIDTYDRNYYLATSYVFNATSEVGVTEDGLRYAILNDGSVAVYGASDKTITSVIIPEKINGRSVTAIGALSFTHMSGVETVDIPKSVSSIGTLAFYRCKVKNFYYRAESASFPDDLREFCTFNGTVSSPANIYIANTVKSIPQRIFNSSVPKNVYFEENSLCESVGRYAFSTVYTLVLSDLTTVESYGFNNCSSTSLYLPYANGQDASALVASLGFSPKAVYYLATDSVTETGTYWRYAEDGYTPEIFDYVAAGYSAGLKYDLSSDGTHFILSGIGSCTDTVVKVPPTYNGLPVSEVKKSAFYTGASFVESFVLPLGITAIGENAFINTAFYNDLNNWEDGVLYIGTYLIKAEPSYLSGDTVTVKAGTTLIGSAAFYSVSASTVILPEGLLYIDSYAFYKCSSTNINLPTTLLSIGECAFMECNISGELVIPVGVTKIQAQAFYKALNLTSLTLHEGIVSIGADAFYNCKNLATVINHSSLKLTMGTTGWGYVARYATTVVNTKYDA